MEKRASQVEEEVLETPPRAVASAEKHTKTPEKDKTEKEQGRRRCCERRACPQGESSAEALHTKPYTLQSWQEPGSLIAALS